MGLPINSLIERRRGAREVHQDSRTDNKLHFASKDLHFILDISVSNSYWSTKWYVADDNRNCL